MNDKICVAVQLPSQTADKLDECKNIVGKSKNAILTDFIEQGIKTCSAKSLFFVKVRIDVAKLQELGEKLQKGELDTSNILSTYCVKNDPTVGLNIWQAKDQKDFDKKFAPHKEYYAEVIEITEVVRPEQAMQFIMKKMSK